jgi:hypothetical protein
MPSVKVYVKPKHKFQGQNRLISPNTGHNDSIMDKPL